jgi:hypothetical protein
MITHATSVLEKIPVVNLVTTLVQRYRSQQQYVGWWETLDIVGRDWVPVENASLAIIGAPWPWSTTLHVNAYDIVHRGRRHHRSRLEIDLSHPTLARRIVIYEDQEVSRQLIEVIDQNHLLVIPAESDYRRHVLRRVTSRLGLN